MLFRATCLGSYKVCQAEPLRHLNRLSASRCRQRLIDSVLLAGLNHATHKIHQADLGVAGLGKPRHLPTSLTRLHNGQLALACLDQPWSGRTRCSPATNEWNNTSGQCVRSLRRLATRSADSVSRDPFARNCHKKRQRQSGKGQGLLTTECSTG